MRKPNENDIRKAREYLRLRIDAELSMVRNLESVMREAAKRIVEICFAYNISPDRLKTGDISLRMQWDLNAVVDWLNETLWDYVETLAVEAHKDNRDVLWAYVFGNEYGATFEERLTDYTGKFLDEILVLCGAGVALGFGVKALSASIGRHLMKPWSNPELKAELSAHDIPSYGKGRTNSMGVALRDLTKNAVGRGWMMNRHVEAELKEAVGFWTFRNSTYPCPLCDSYAEVFHPMGDEIPPIHGHCVCGTVYVNAIGEFLNF